MPVIRLPPLTSLRAFDAVARRRSFKIAASELGVTPSAISHQIRQLEDHVGVRLLDRTPRAVSITEAGQILQEATAAGFEVIATAIHRIRSTELKPMLTLSATGAFLSLWLVPRLSRLQNALPNLDMRFHASDAVETFVPGRIDVAIRYGEGPYPDLASRNLASDELVPVCSPALGVASADDLRHVSLIHVDGRSRPNTGASWRHWCEAAEVSGLDVERGPHLPDGMSAVQAAIAGQGVAIASRILVAGAIEAGLLVAPFEVGLAGDAYHFVAPESVLETKQVRELCAWFVEEFGSRQGGA